MTTASSALSVLLSVLAMTPLQKAEAVVVTTVRPGVFAGAAGITFADQEGGAVRALRGGLGNAACAKHFPGMFTIPAHARRAVRALLPLARRGELDRHLVRILTLRRDVRPR